MKRSVFLILVGAFLISGTAAYAHHSFAGTYHEDDEVTIEGQLVQFMYRNPHSFVHVIATDDNGDQQRWAIEWGGIAQLNRQGLDRFTLKPGETVRITGAPSRSVDTDHRLLMRGIERNADGWTWGGEVD
jgi:hypothetical protein